MKVAQQAWIGRIFTYFLYLCGPETPFVFQVTLSKVSPKPENFQPQKIQTWALYSDKKMATASLVPTSKIFSVSPKSSASIKARSRVVVASSQQQQQPRRRELLLKSAVAIPAILQLKEAPISAAREVEVGSYLPLSPSDPSFVLFKAKPSDTPALRAGDA